MSQIIIILLIIGLFFLQKVGSHGQLLKSPYNTIYKVYNSFFGFINGYLRHYIKPINIGRGIDLDIVPFILLFVLLVIMKAI